MSLDFEYGINIGNRFLDLLGHDEDPDQFIANQIQINEKEKKHAKETKISSKSNTKPAKIENKVSNDTAKANKENLAEKKVNNDQRKQQPTVLSDNNYQQQPRTENARGGSARGGAFHDRPQYRGRGRGQPRSAPPNRNEGQFQSNETSGFEQSNNLWTNETPNENQTFTSFRGRGRGGPRRGDFDRGRSRGRGRGRGRGGQFYNRNFDSNSQQQQQQQPQEFGGWQETVESNFETQNFSTPQTGDQDLNQEVSQQEQPNEPTNIRRGGRGHFRSRTFRSRNYGGGDRFHQNENGNETGGVRRENYGFRGRPYDRQSRSRPFVGRPVEKKDDEHVSNWENQEEKPEEQNINVPENNEQTSTAPKDWAQQVDEAEKQMTLDEYKLQLEVKRRAQQNKLPQFHKRNAGEGEDPKHWSNFKQEYRKRADSNDGDVEQGSGEEENESGEEGDEERMTGKKKIITIPLHFKPIDFPRGTASSRGGPRRGFGRFPDQQRPTSSNQQQSTISQPTGEFQNDEQQPRPYRGGFRPGSGRGEFRQIYRNSTRSRPRGGSGGGPGQYRSNIDPNKIDIHNPLDFPDLSKP